MEKILDIVMTILIALTFIGWFIEIEILYTITASVMVVLGIVYYFKYILFGNNPSENSPKEKSIG